MADCSTFVHLAADSVDYYSSFFGFVKGESKKSLNKGKYCALPGRAPAGYNLVTKPRKEVEIMKKILASAALAALLTAQAAAASPAGSLTVNGAPVEAAGSYVHQNTTYVPLRAVAEALRPDAVVAWETDRAAIRADGLEVTARPGDAYIRANGRTLAAPHGVHLSAGRTLVPVRVLAEAMGASVHWNSATGAVSVVGGASADTTETEGGDDLYWLSRIISAESRGEPLEGQIAVGNVVLNRVASADFPDTIYGVIFDDRWGGQFTPVRNGTIYQEPSARSVEAARLCLSGANTAGESLYFLAPALATNHWVMENRTHVVTIGSHWFYK